MSEARAANAMAYGMMAAEPGIDLLCLGEMGIANTTVAATLCAALFGGTGADWAGPGTGVQGAALSHKIAVIDEALAHHRDAIAARAIRLTLLATVGGEELAAIAGTAVLAARMRPHPGAARRLCLHGRRRRAVRRGPPCARPLQDRAPLGRARPHAPAEDDRPAAVARDGHAAGRSLGCSARRVDPQGRRRLPQRHGDLRRGGRQRQRA